MEINTTDIVWVIQQNTNTPLWQSRSMVASILSLGNDAEWKKLVMQNMDWESIGTISYEFYDQDFDSTKCKICSINFFGTQNGKKEERYSTKLECLWNYSWNTRHISYEMMNEFITKICKPRSIEKVYLVPDWYDKEVFWIEKMWQYLIQKWLIQEQYIKDDEVCYVL
jgi:hypothetical protein